MNLLERLSSSSLEQLIPTPDGAFTLKYENRYLHSSRSPLKEAKKMIAEVLSYPPNETLVIIWGTGLGYHIDLLIEYGYSVVAIEFRPEISAFFETIYPTEKLLGFLKNSYPTEIFDFLVTIPPHQYKHYVDFTMLGLSVPPKLLLQKDQAITALRSLYHTKKALIDSWYLNIIQNICLFSQAHVFYTFDPIFQGQQLVICSAGPSLRESLPYIHKYRPHITVLAVDTALLSLIQYGVIPDFVHAVDAKIHNIADFRGINHDILSQITLIADLTLNHQILLLPWKAILLVSTVQPIIKNQTLIHQRDSLQQYLWDHQIRFPETQTGGSVATSAFHLGILYQADKIWLTGQDLAYSQHRGHALGSPYDMEYRLQTCRLNSLDSIHLHKIPFERQTVLDIHGKVTYSDHLLDQFRSWFEVSLKDNPDLVAKVINASENGAFFQNWQHQALSSGIQFPAPKESLPYTRSHYAIEDIHHLLQTLANLPMDFNTPHPICQDFFYKERHSSSTSSAQIEKKTQLFYKKIQKYLCPH
ncbi:MAG: motility associated factor glycosyltransferase family protein [Brevinema sp.]